MFSVIGLIISIVNSFVLIGISVYIKNNKQSNDGYNYLFYSCLCALEWTFSCAMIFVSTNKGFIRFWYAMKDIGMALLPICLLLFSSEFNKMEIKFSKKGIAFFMIIPIITIILAFTNKYHHLVHTEFDMTMANALKSVTVQKGKWNYFFISYSGSIYFTSFLMYFYQNERKSKTDIKRCSTFAIGFLILLFSIYSGFFDLFGRYDLSFIGLTISMVIFYNGLIRYPNNDFSNIARDTVFEKISSIALVVDNNGNIVEYNPSAKETFSFMNIDIDGANYEKVIKNWLIQSNGYVETNDTGRIISVHKAGKRYYYQVTESEIKDNSGTVFGTFVELSNITLQQESIQELFKLVNTDQLTGLFNRRYFDNMCVKYDKEIFFPLAIFSGDLNRLKHTNDTYGHAYGDRLISLIAEILKKAAPKNSVICRHGGDEFSVIIPNSSRGEAVNFIRRVDKICLESAEEPFGTPSISLGFAFKENMSQNIKDVIDAADKMMYDVKAKKHKIADDLSTKNLSPLEQLQAFEDLKGNYIEEDSMANKNNIVGNDLSTQYKNPIDTVDPKEMQRIAKVLAEEERLLEEEEKAKRLAWEKESQKIIESEKLENQKPNSFKDSNRINPFTKNKNLVQENDNQNDNGCKYD